MQKRISAFNFGICLVLCLATLICGLCFLGKGTFVSAEAENSFSYKSQLSNKEILFYNTLNQNTAKLYDGKSAINLLDENVLTSADVAAFENGSSDILKTFAAGRDAFMLEHPEVFYVDFDKLSLNLAKDKDGNFIAELGTGRYDNYYLTQDLTAEKVQTMVKELNSRILAITTQINSEIPADATPQEKQYLQIVKTLELIRNDSMNKSEYFIEYNFCSSQEDALYAPYIRTAYSLVTQKAVCEGLSKSFKVIMDKFEIPCIEVIGYWADYNTETQTTTNEPHSWNMVYLANNWYFVDPTDYISLNIAYPLKGVNNMKGYLVNNTVSLNGKSFALPKDTATFNYGEAEIKVTVTDEDKFIVNYTAPTYSMFSGEDKPKTYYMAIQNGYLKNGEINWYDPYTVSPTFSQQDGYHQELGVAPATQFWKFIVTAQEPDRHDTSTNMAQWTLPLDANKIFAESDIILNKNYNEEKAKSATVTNVTPSAGVISNAKNTHQVTITYSKNIQANGGEPSVVVWSAKYGCMNEYVKIENLSLGTNSVSFKFTPSKAYLHNSVNYSFSLVNVKTTDGYGIDTITLPFQMPSYACSKVFNDGRLYIDAFATPTLVDNQDLSLTGWKYQFDGDEPEAEAFINQRSQLALVATSVSDEDKADMEGVVEKSEVIKSSSTFEIDLNLCGSVVVIPEGSYVKVAFGFPEGFNAKSAGTTFKLFHFKRDANGKIDTSSAEEISCTVTEYGIVAVLNSFSPFMIVATNKTDTSKNVYVRNVNNGGTFEITKNQTKQNAALSIGENESLTIQITTDENSDVDYVLVNKEAISVTDGKITLDYASLKDNNTIDIAYVAKSVKQKETDQGITSLNKTYSQNATVASTNKPVKWIYLILIVVVAVGAVVTLLIARQKRKQNK